MGEPRGWYSRGYLPHFDSPERIQHVVFRTVGSLPRGLENDALAPRERAWAADDALDRSHGGRLLSDPRAAHIVEKALLYFDGERYLMLAWCVMPNHVHALFAQVEGVALPDVVRSWKSYTASRINAMEGRRGAFWARDYFDRFMRNEAQLDQTIAYIEANPVKAGLCAAPADWAYSSARLRG